MKSISFVFFSIFFFMIVSGYSKSFAQFEMEKSAPALITDDTWAKSFVDLKKSMDELMQKNDLLASENNVLRKKIVELQETYKKLQADREQYAKEPIRLNETLKQKTEAAILLEKNIRDLKERVSSFEKERADLLTKISQRDERQKSFEDEKQALKARIDQLMKEQKAIQEKNQQALKNLENERNNLTKLVQESRVKEAKAEKDLAEIKLRPVALGKEKLLGINQRQAQRQEQLAQVKKELAKVIDERDTAKEENKRLLAGQEGTSHLNQELEVLRVKNKELENSLASLKGDMGTKEAALSQRQVKDLEAKLTSLQEDNASLKSKIAEQMEQMVKLNREKAMIDSLLDVQVKAAKKREKIVARKSENTTHQLAAYQYAASGQYEKAIEEYTLAVKEDPFKKDNYYNLGFIYAKLNKYNEAITNYKQVLELDPKDKEANFNLSQIYKKLSDIKSSQQYYNRYLELKDK